MIERGVLNERISVELDIVNEFSWCRYITYVAPYKDLRRIHDLSILMLVAKVTLSVCFSLIQDCTVRMKLDRPGIGHKIILNFTLAKSLAEAIAK